MVNIVRQLTTQRLFIRSFNKNDWKDLYEYLSDEKVIHFEPYEVFNEEQCKHEAMKRSKNEAFLAVCLKETNKVIGNLYFAEQEFNTWELGYVFNHNYQGSGYATEGAREVLRDAFDNLGARRVIAMCDPENVASWKLLERLGMRREGHLLKNVYFKKDKTGSPIWKDTYEYAILEDEWRSLSS
ncbi:MAG: family N-acetyltransferase [Herbinix sp.]|jgi:RimJ/RimL family protein N-acetyltransferase|nr:family N-acetyltransferase [Herbinix sp.]